MRPLDWKKLRPHHGNQQNSFEQLCATLAHRDKARALVKSEFIRNGRPDGGCECYWTAENGAVHGYQAKFHCTAMGKSQWDQLDVSMKRALKSFPRLASMTVCLPQDLPNSPGEGKNTARQTWNKWRDKWRRLASKRGRPLVIHLWDQHALTTALARRENQWVLAFFFDADVLAVDSLRERLGDQFNEAGIRYQPKLHVSHELEPLFEWLVGSEKHRRHFREQFAAARALIESEGFRTACHRIESFSAQRKNLIAALTSASTCMNLPQMEGLSTCSSQLATAMESFDSMLHELGGSWQDAHQDDSPKAVARREREWYIAKPFIEQFEVIRSGLSPLLRSSWRMGESFCQAASRRIVLLHGSGGCGKTHLVCEMASRASENGCPVVLVLGHQLSVEQYENIVVSRAGISGSLEGLLGAMDAAGEVAGCRSLLIVDALNEADEPARWTGKLRALVSQLVRFPHVVLVLTVRDVYLDQVWPKSNENTGIARFVHSGFAGNSEEALAKYCAHYNITLPDVPAFHPEFDNPLFVSIFCQSVGGDPKVAHTRSPVAFRGDVKSFSDLFDLFIDFRERELLEKAGVDHDVTPKPLRAALDELAAEMAKSSVLELSALAARTILDKHVRSKGPIPNILGLIESQGLLQRFPRLKQDGSAFDVIQFSYDRMGAHFVVRHWLRVSGANKAVAEIFGPGGSYAIFSENHHAVGRERSIREAILIQWPEVFGRDLFNCVPQLLKNSSWRRSFLLAMSHSSSDSLRDTTGQLIHECLNSSGDDNCERLDLVLRLLMRVSNPPLVATVHDYLARQSLAGRDCWWTTGISAGDGDSIARRMIEWQLQKPEKVLEREVAIACATALAWLTAATSLELRARATKAIAAALVCQVECAETVLERFALINDPQVVQSVTRAIYGACLRSRDNEQIVSVGKRVLKLFPEKKRWPRNIHTRHSLCGIVEVAKESYPAWTVDLTRVRPPYESEWIENPLTWAAIEKKVQADGKLKLYGYSTIVQSCRPHYGKHSYGDFGRYTVDSACSAFFKDAGLSSLKTVIPFEPDLPHRFIIQRVTELGWTTQAFNDFDRNCTQGNRHQNTVERIGKKYQWIALFEFLAMASDRFPLQGGSWGSQRGRAFQYAYPRQLMYAEHIDTSLLHARQSDQRAEDKFKPGGHGKMASLWDGTSHTVWMKNDTGFPNPQSLLGTTDEESGRTLTVLGGFIERREMNPESLEEQNSESRSVWLRVHAFCVRPKDVDRLRDWISTDGPDWPEVPSLPGGGDSLFGELYWSRTARGGLSVDGGDPDRPWHVANRWNRTKDTLEVIPLSGQYHNESDATFGSALNVQIAGKWVIESLGLRAGPEDLLFTDMTGAPVCWNLSVNPGNPDCVVCDTERLLEAVDVAGLSLVWCVFGEKTVYGMPRDNPRLIQPRLQGFYWSDGERIRGSHEVFISHGLKFGASHRFSDILVKYRSAKPKARAKRKPKSRKRRA